VSAATSTIALRLALVGGALLAALWALDRLGALADARLAVRWGPNTGAAVHAAPFDEIARGWPVLSLVMADEDLRDPVRGLLANVLEHGADWERRGTVAYFDDGRLRFAADVGVRVHGGGSRLTSERQGFRLYFRKQYGATQVPAGALFGPDAQPIHRLVVHNDLRVDRGGDRWRLANPLAYDISRAMGAMAPETQPVRFVLNGEPQGMFVLTERVDEDFFFAHEGHRQVRADQTEFEALWQWAGSTRPMRMADAAARVDLENLTRWFLAVAFCATRDAYQGPSQFRDLTREHAAWRWVTWDMDLSFRVWDSDSYAFLLEPVGGPRRGRNPAEPRATLLTRLLTDDPAYRAYVAAMFDRVMNHHVTPAFLEERLAHYRAVATELSADDNAFLEPLAVFLERRPAFFRTLTEQWLDVGPSQPLRVSMPASAVVTIDDEPVRGSFDGRYLPDREIVLAIADGADHFVEWRVNGASEGRGPVLRLALSEPTHVEAVFDAEGPQGGLVPPVTAGAGRSGPARVDGSPAPLRWITVPAGSFDAGCIPDDPDCDGNERPRHRASVDAPFDMLATEVTVAQFAAFAAATAWRLPRQPTWIAEASHPVVNVTWDEAAAFCRAADGRLPTEVEWEYAARGGAAGRLFPWPGGFDGQANLEDVKAADQFPFTAPVGAFAPNGFGVHDVIGNVWEWTADRYDPEAPDDAFDIRTVRGGSWMTGPRGARISERAGLSRIGRHNREVGFRCVR
jgi:formylglycine-generating enzyme required for sulfatase activity